MVKVLGLADLFIAFLLLSAASRAAVPWEIIAIFSLFVLAKAIPFLPDIGSIMDCAAISLLILSIFVTIPAVILIIAAIFLGIKGIMSLFAF